MLEPSRVRRFVAAAVLFAMVVGPVGAGADPSPEEELLNTVKTTAHEVLALVLGLLPDEADALLDRLGLDPVSLVPLQPDPPAEERTRIPDQPGPDPSSPASRARATEDEYDDASADPENAPYQGQLTESRARFDRAMGEWRGGDTIVPDFLEILASAADALVAPRGETIAPRVGFALAGIGRHVGGRIVDSFERAGADRELMARLARILAESDEAISLGDYGGAIGGLNDIFDLGPHLVFDLDLFEQNIRDVFDTRTVGYSYAIADEGQLARSGQNGNARTSNNSPTTSQSASKEMNIASVSKTLTAVAVLRLLEDRGLTIDSSIEPWLPSQWVRGSGINGLTFRRLMTQTSGLNNNDGSQPYDYFSSAAAIAGGVDAPQTFQYQNLNFALFRVMIPRLALYPMDVLQQFLGSNFDAAFSAAVYKQYMRDELFAPMGIDGDCAPNDSAMTLLYNPNSSSGGINAGDWTTICGSGGWYLSSIEIAAYLAHARYNNAILSPAMRTVMNQNFTGWMDPANYNWGDGTWGTYHNHGGDLWWDGNLAANVRRGMDSCAMSYPGGVQVSLLINSQGPAYPGHANSNYQCAALEAAYDDAWVLVN